MANGLSDVHNIFIFTLIDIEPFYPLKTNVVYKYCKKSVTHSSNIIQALNNNFSFYKELKHLTVKHNIDLLIGFTTNVNVLTVLCARKLNIPVIISERNNPEKIFIPKIWKLLTKITYPKANLLVVQTSLIKNYYNKILPPSKIHILPNPLAKIHSQTKKQYKLPKKNIVLNVGRLTDQKGQEILIKVFAEINPKNWELHIVGEGYKRNDFVKLIQDLDMKNKIKLIGRNNHISEYYLKSKIFVFPSRYEGFPNALTEAMYMGLPCISTDCPTGPSELIKNGENGILIEVDNKLALKKYLNSLMLDELLRSRLGNNASESVNYLEEKNVVKIWEKLISKALKA